MAAKVKVNYQDITRNLPSLTFESALDEEELQLLYLRKQSHAHTVLVSSTCAFLVHIMNEARQIRADLSKTPKQRRAIQLLTADTLPKDPLKVGLIGCGRLGTHIANSLLSFSSVNGEDMFISTRRPETTGQLKEKGVNVRFDNKGVASTVHILFICVLPSQLASVIEEIHAHVGKHTIIYCLVNHTTAHKLRRISHSANIIIPNFVFDNSLSNTWNCCMGIHQALKDEKTIQKCCPLSKETKDSCVRLTDKWVELVICAFMNMCTDLKMTSQASLDLLHGICIGMDRLEKETFNRFVERDFIINWDIHDTEPRLFPKFDLSKIHDNDSQVIKKLRASPILQQNFVRKFSSVFTDSDNLINSDENEQFR